MDTAERMAFEIARRHALEAGRAGHTTHAYLPTSFKAAKEWAPHEWVVAAIVEALFARPSAPPTPPEAEMTRPYGACSIAGPAEDVSFILRHLPDIDEAQLPEPTAEGATKEAMADLIRTAGHVTRSHAKMIADVLHAALSSPASSAGMDAQRVDTLPTAPAKGYVAGGGAYFYPGAGDPLPPGGAKVHLLTRGGVTVTGCWGSSFFIGWAPLHERDRLKEASL